MIEAAHYLKDGVFVCSGGEDARCHNYPSCDCEIWDAETHDKPEGEHADSPHEECWMTPWLNAVMPSDTNVDNLPNNKIRDGVVSLIWDGEGVTWRYPDFAPGGMTPVTAGALLFEEASD